MRQDQFQIVEGIGGHWHYHLAPVDQSAAIALCGAMTMSTAAPLSSWGYKPTHIPTSYCETCEQLARQEVHGAGKR
jgi:hypothetical protein